MTVTVTLIAAVLSSSVIAALLTSLFTKLSADKKVRIDTITSERKEWRVWLRSFVKDVNANAYDGKWSQISVLKSELTVRLNPLDREDNGILTCLANLVTSENTSELQEFNDRMALLLKHDWERVKIEAGGMGPVRSLAVGSVFGSVIVTGLYGWFDHIYHLDGLRESSILLLGSVLFVVSLLAASYIWLVDTIIAHSTCQPKKATAPFAFRFARWLARINNRDFRVPYGQS